jgi:hypothetical protein
MTYDQDKSVDFAQSEQVRQKEIRKHMKCSLRDLWGTDKISSVYAAGATEEKGLWSCLASQ